jgi:hypothetical protein
VRTLCVLLALAVIAIGLSARALSAGASATRNEPVALAACVSRPSGKAIDEGTPSRSLLSILGVLRRPATPADSLPASWLYSFTSGAVARIQGGEVFVRYVRRARVIGDTTYYLIPSLFTGCGVYKITGEGITILRAQSKGTGSGGAHFDAAQIEQGKAYGFSGGFTHTTITMLIPDGVASVTLHYPPGQVGGSNHNPAPAFTITTDPVENVLVVTVPRGGNRFMAPLTMTWRSASGTTVRTLNSL